jgi:hypothetical protein
MLPRRRIVRHQPHRAVLRGKNPETRRAGLPITSSQMAAIGAITLDASRRGVATWPIAGFHPDGGLTTADRSPTHRAGVHYAKTESTTRPSFTVARSGRPWW